jgi:alpha-beta hydrolase superfamily lysophospholipase
LKELTLDMSDGFKLYAFIKEPTIKPIGHIHLLHGMAEHVGRYEFAINFFCEQGFIVSGHDHRGHGQTALLNGMKGYFAENDGFNRVVQDTHEVISEVKTGNPALKFILLGHSMGSFIARRYIQLHGDDVDLAIFSGTGDDSGIARYGGLAFAHLAGRRKGYTERNHLIDSFVFGAFNKKIDNPQTKFDWLSKNEHHVSDYILDEKCGFIPTTQFFIDLFNGLGLIHKKREIAKVPKNLPILLFSGVDDPVGNYGKAVWKVARQYHDANIDEVTVLIFEEGRHELLNDPAQVHVLEAVLEWMQKR